MARYSPASTLDLSFPGGLSQAGPSPDSQQPSNGLHGPAINILDDYSLRSIFYFSRSALLSESDDDEILAGGKWNHEWWWCKLVQVCRRWRYIVLESPSHLRLSLLCARGTLVAEMLAHSPPLPLIIDILSKRRKITAENQESEGIVLALQHHDSVRRIRLGGLSMFQKLIHAGAFGGEYPILEFLHVVPPVYFNFPENFRAPHLRYLLLGSPKFTTIGNLVSRSIRSISFTVHPSTLLQWLSLMLELEVLKITVTNGFDDVARQLLSRTPIMTRVTLPNLRWFGFQGDSTQLEVLLSHVTIPHLEKLQVYFLDDLPFSTELQQFMSTLGNLLLNSITITFLEDHINVMAYPHKGARMYTSCMTFDSTDFDWQFWSTAEFCHVLRTALSAVEHLTLKYDRHLILSSEEPYRTQWRKLLESFGGAKTLCVDGELVEQLSRALAAALQPGEGESPMELLPELQELSYPAIVSSLNVFTPFIDSRQRAGRSVTTVHTSD